MAFIKRSFFTMVATLFFAALTTLGGCSGDANTGVNKEPIEDVDGDGIADIVDPDMDGDGIPNEQDPDDDNDGVEDSIDPTPPLGPSSKTCVAATILPPNDGTFPGDNDELSWELLPQGCVLPATRANAGAGVTVRAAPQRTGTATSATVNAGNCVAQGRNGKVQCFTEIKVPEGCGQFAVVYDISEVGVVLGDTNLSKGAYRQTVWHTGKSCVDEGLPNPCTQAINLKINGKNPTGASTKITWDFAPSGCQLNDQQAESVAVVTAYNQWLSLIPRLRIRSGGYRIRKPGLLFQIVVPGIEMTQRASIEFGTTFRVLATSWVIPTVSTQEIMRSTLRTVTGQTGKVVITKIPNQSIRLVVARSVKQVRLVEIHVLVSLTTAQSLKVVLVMQPPSTSITTVSRMNLIPTSMETGSLIRQITISMVTVLKTKTIPISMVTAKPTVLIRMPMVTVPPTLKMTRQVGLSNHP